MNPSALRPILISIPHASLSIPEELLGMVKIDRHTLIRSIDLFTEKMYGIHGYHIIEGEICRVFVDVNRAPDDAAKEYNMGRDGVIVHTTHDGEPIYADPPSEQLMEQIVEKYHTPYHDKIDAIMPKIQFLFDCHSYRPTGPKMKNDAGEERPHVNIGNRRYSTCTREHTVFAREFFETNGLSVGINVPYMGGYVLAHHCHRRRIPAFLVPGMQIEINQNLYLQDNLQDPLPGKVEELQTLFQEFVDAFYQRFCRPA